jgi:type IV secretory pathway VirB2 component (pilin)
MSEQPKKHPDAGIPKWLIYGFAVKMALVVVITVGVMWWAGVFS